MNKKFWLSFAFLAALAGAVQATDVVNQDSAAYSIKVQGEGNLSISTHTLQGNGSLYGLCSYSFCTFEIASDKTSAKRDERLTIRNGKFVK